MAGRWDLTCNEKVDTTRAREYVVSQVVLEFVVCMKTGGKSILDNVKHDLGER